MAGEVKFAVIGAGGFIGNRLVEYLHLSGQPVRPIVRHPSALALAKRFDLSGYVADATDEAQMSGALTACEVLIHAAAGSPQQIQAMVTPAVRAAARAGCRRVVYLSTAMVHGQAPVPGTNETSPLPSDQRLAYNLAKRRAETLLFCAADKAGIEACVLRPGIVYGPRSKWIGNLADAVLKRRAILVDGGHGLVNSIYVDNVAHAVALAADASSAAGEAFLLGEDDVPSWSDFTERVRTALDCPADAIRDVSYHQSATTLLERLDRIRESEPVRRALGRLPKALREALAAGWGASGLMPSPSAEPAANVETALLHRARHVPEWTKARERLGYRPVVSAPEAWSRTIAWLRHAGYPVSGG